MILAPAFLLIAGGGAGGDTQRKRAAERETRDAKQCQKHNGKSRYNAALYCTVHALTVTTSHTPLSYLQPSNWALTFQTNMYTWEMDAGLLKSTCWARPHRSPAATM